MGSIDAVSGSGASVRRVFDGDTVRRLHELNAVSRRLRGLGFVVAQESVKPADGGEPVLGLRAVSARGQQVLLGMVSGGNTLHLKARMRTCTLDGVRLAWPDCAVRGG